jgi:4-hydroxy-4-methyl-2-oxoglutarate aldolase
VAAKTGEEISDVVAQLAGIDVCTVSDALDALGLAGSVLGIGPMWEGARVAGRAVTVQLAEGPSPSEEPVHLGVRAIAASRPGDVIVVANGGRIGMGAWGGLLCTAAKHRGVAGVIVDGACRDVDEAREMEFPAFARAPVVRTARGRVHEQSYGAPVSLGDVEVRTGDLVVADGSGVAVVPIEAVAAVARKARELVERESRMRSELLAGASVEEVLGQGYQRMLT